MQNFIDVQHYRKLYEELPQFSDGNCLSKETVDDAFNAVVQSLTEIGIKPATDDRAEELVAAILHYIDRSKVYEDPLPFKILRKGR